MDSIGSKLTLTGEYKPQEVANAQNRNRFFMRRRSSVASMNTGKKWRYDARENFQIEYLDASWEFSPSEKCRKTSKRISPYPVHGNSS